MCYDNTEQIMLANETKLAYEHLKKMIVSNDPDMPRQLMKVKILHDRLSSWGVVTLFKDEFEQLYKQYFIYLKNKQAWENTTGPA